MDLKVTTGETKKWLYKCIYIAFWTGLDIDNTVLSNIKLWHYLSMLAPLAFGEAVNASRPMKTTQDASVRSHMLSC